MDAGSLWGLDDVIGATGQVDDRARLRAAIGVTLRVRTGLGPVEIYAAYPVMKQSYDRTQSFGLSFSQRF
jgi:outer membrane protein insertion porin family